MQLLTGRLPRDEAYCSALPQFSDVSNLIPEPVDQWSSVDLATANMGMKIGDLFPIDGNDRYGDCTIAGLAHFITLLYAMLGKKVIPTAQEVVDLYWHLSRGRDSGLPLTTALSAWMQGVFSTNEKINVSFNVKPKNLYAVKQCIQYFGAAYIGFNTSPDSVSRFQQGQPWVESQFDGGGHCVVATGWDDDKQLFEFLTWGGRQYGTYAFWNHAVDEVHGVVTPMQAVLDNSTVEYLRTLMPALSV